MNRLGKNIQSGFTVLEAILVTSIIVILTAIIIPNYKNAQADFALERSASKLAQDVRRAAELALSSAECPIPPADGGCGSKTVNGYGIHFKQGTNDSYDLYVDLAPPPDNQKWTGDDKVVETLYLEQGVIIQSIDPSGSFSVNFKPPSPTTKIRTDSNDFDNDQAVITLALANDSTKTKVVKINKVGLVSAE